MVRQIRIIFLALSSFASHLSAETIFYKKSGQPITKEEHEQLYEIVLENEFPMCIAFGTCKDDELQEIQRQVKARFPSIAAFYVPTVLYQLFALKLGADHKNNLSNATENAIWSYSSIGGVSFKSDADVFDYNLKPSVITLHRILNNYIVGTLQSHFVNIPMSISDCHTILRSASLWTTASEKLFLSKDAVLDDMERAITLEYTAFQDGKFLLYRGSQTVDDGSSSYGNFDSTYWTNRAISFGSSLLNGIINDTGACAYCIMNSRDIGYAIPISKKDFARGYLYNHFYLPILNNILGLFGHGEIFHPRTKVPDAAKVKEFGYKAPSLKIYIQIPGKNTQQTYKQTLEYIKKNYILFKSRQPAPIAPFTQVATTPTIIPPVTKPAVAISLKKLNAKNKKQNTAKNKTKKKKWN